MNEFERNISSVLSEDTDIPDVVWDKANMAFSQIQGGLGKRTVRKNKRWNGARAAAAAVAAILVAGTTAYASGKYFGIWDFFGEQGTNLSTEAENLVERDVVTATNQMAGDEVRFNIREAVCDSNQIYVVVEAKPADAERYMVLAEDVMLDESMKYLNAGGNSEETVREYAVSRNKEILYAGARIDSDVCTTYFKLEEDGTGIFVIYGENADKKKVLDLRCSCSYYEASEESVTVEDVTHRSIDFVLHDISTGETNVYYPVEKEVTDGSNTVVKRVELTRTELGLYAKLQYRVTQEAGYGAAFSIMDANGEELPHGVGVNSVVQEVSEGVYEVTYCYGLMDLPEQLKVQCDNIDTDEKSEPVIMQLSEQ
ncbi:MAG: hypothetical protein NC300_09395 [Bacteroidales bacterium]|nr:hypothetical protein [Clostridium sp.]MCM1204345.1 hypothetical protein [Bacteroidales bacterium]